MNCVLTIRNCAVHRFDSNGNWNPFLIWSRFDGRCECPKSEYKCALNIFQLFQSLPTCRCLHSSSHATQWFPFGGKTASVSIFNEQSNYIWLIITRHTRDYRVVVSHNNFIFITAALCFPADYEEIGAGRGGKNKMKKKICVTKNMTRLMGFLKKICYAWKRFPAAQKVIKDSWIEKNETDDEVNYCNFRSNLLILIRESSESKIGIIVE